MISWFQCGMGQCDISKSKWYNFLDHLRSHKKISTRVWMMCMTTQVQKANMIKHVKQHIAVNIKERQKFRCFDCKNAGFTNQDNLKVDRVFNHLEPPDGSPLILRGTSKENYEGYVWESLMNPLKNINLILIKDNNLPKLYFTVDIKLLQLIEIISHFTSNTSYFSFLFWNIKLMNFWYWPYCVSNKFMRAESCISKLVFSSGLLLKVNILPVSRYHLTPSE